MRRTSSPGRAITCSVSTACRRAPRDKVRWKLSNIFVKHCYFSKVQFSPLGRWTAGNLPKAECDAAAADFLREVMPTVLQQLPVRRKWTN